MNELGTEKINKLLLKFSLPSVVSLVLNAIYNMIDQIFIGQGVGYLANGATNVIFPLMQLAVAIGLLIGDGTASFINLKLGQNDQKAASKGMAAGIVGLLISGIILVIVYNIFLEPLCWLFGATDQTLPYALQYGRVISCGIIFCMFSCGTMSMIRADGSPGVAMMGLVAGCVVNLIGDPVAIFILGWGVRGAAIATISGQIVNMIINVCYLTHCKSVTLDAKARNHCISFIPRVAKMGLSSFITQFAVVIVIVFQNNVLVSYGAKSEYGAEIPMTALGVTMKVFTILQSAIAGLMAGSQPIFGYNYGSGQYARVKETLKKTLLISILIMAIATVWFQVAPMTIVSLFGTTDEMYIKFSVMCLRVFLLLIVLDAVQMVASSFLQSIGKAAQGSVLVFFRQLIIQIPAMLILASIFGVEGVLYAGPVSSFLVFIPSAIFLIREWRDLNKKEKAAFDEKV